MPTDISESGAHLRPERVRRYLPFKLYNDLNLRPGPETGRRAISHLAALLETVQTYCAAPILAEALPAPRNVQGRWCDATLLFADISGFTPMSEKLNARGRAGAEEITRIVNAYFTTMVKHLHRNGGVLLKFGGDALLGLFAGPAHDTACYAVQAAVDMQRDMAQFAGIDTSVGRFELQMKVGVHTGRVFAAHVGTGSQVEYWVTGEDVNLTAWAEEVSEGGQVVASEATRRYLTAWDSLEPLPSQSPGGLSFYTLPLPAEYQPLPAQPILRAGAVPQKIPELARRLDTLTPYLPKGLLPRLVHNPRHRRVEGEHRLVAVLFINVDGFSALAQVLAPGEPEQVRGSDGGREQIRESDGGAGALTETMQDYFATVQSIIERHGGTINKTDLYSEGDKLLAVFGAPVAHGDDVDQAARAALAMQVALEGINQRLAERCPTAGVRLRQRIGISTGHVFSGNVGAEVRQEYTIMGDEVNLAARLMSAAAWGEVWVSSHVFYWLEPFGTFEFVGDLQVKGKENPVPVYRMGAMGEARRPQPIFVDREQPLATLRGKLDQLLQDLMQGQIFLLSGEPGIGKSRLWSELSLDPLAEDVLWLTGRCHEQGVTYHLIADMLRGYLELTATDDPETQRHKLVQRIEELFGPDQVDEKGPFLAIVMGLPLTEVWKKHVEFLGEHLSARLAQETAAFFERLTEDRPLVLICEDLHWLDPGSVEVLLQTIELVEFAPLMLGFTLRPGQAPSYEHIAGQAREQFRFWFTEIPMGPLDPEYCAEIVAAVAPQPVSPAQQRRICRRSGGNPLFISEMARVIFTASRVSVPGTVHILIESRVDELPEGPRQTLKAAAVAGVQFLLSELVHLLDAQERDVRRNLSTLRRMHLIDARGKVFQFVNTLTQEVVYLGQSLEARQAFHRRLGMYWEGQGDAAQAAHHCFAGELWEEALAQSERAADERRQAYANQEAARLYGRALVAAERLEDLAAQARLCGQLGQVHFRAGNYEQAEEVHRRQLELLRGQSADPLAQAEAHYALGCVCDRRGKLDQALDELDQGLRLAGEDPSETRAQLLRERCSVLINMGREKLDEAERDGLRALEIAEEIGARAEEAWACNNLGAVYGTRGGYERALEYHQRALIIRRELGVLYDISDSLNNVGTAYSYLGRLDEAGACFQEALGIQRRIGDRLGEGSSHHNLAWLHLDREEPEAAEVEFLRALALWEGIDYRKGIAFVHNDLGALYLGQAQLNKACDHLEEAAHRYENMGAHTYLPENYAALVDVCLGLRQAEEALDAAQKALEWAQANKDQRQEIVAHRKLAQVYEALGDLDQARRHAQRAEALGQGEE
jgi:class 3 adenylate cyclase/tetratricopeptide (TPR) repeat protein